MSVDTCVCKGRSHVCPTVLKGLLRWPSELGLYLWKIKTGPNGIKYAVLQGYSKAGIK